MGLIEIDRNPSRRTLNQFGFIWLGFLTLFGALAWYKTGGLMPAAVLWVLAIIVPIIGWAVPAFMRLVFLGLSYAAFPIGWVVSHVVLALVFFLVFTPIGLVMRLVGYDPMKRRFDPAATSYWLERSHHGDVKRYFRQF